MGKSKKMVFYIIGIFCLMHPHQEIHATEFVVGDKQGWDLYPELMKWPQGKHFKAGDILVFNYNNPIYSVNAVNESQYLNCNTFGHPNQVYSSGHDRVPLAKGPSYFISGVTDFCGYGMKIAVNAD